MTTIENARHDCLVEKTTALLSSLERILYDALCPHRLTPQAFRVLVHLATEKPGALTHKQLRHIARQNAKVFEATAQSLRDRKYIENSGKAISITDFGLAALNEALVSWERAQKKIRDELDQKLDAAIS